MKFFKFLFAKSLTRSVLTICTFIAALLLVPSIAEAKIPRPEHPKPQFRRDTWVNLNGQWDFAMDPNVVGTKESWQKNPSKFDKKITVPFCRESKLSGIGLTDFIKAVWYRRTFTLPKTWKGKRIFLHFSGVDYECRAWVNSKPVGQHYGGSVSFAFEITVFPVSINGTD